MSFRIEYFDLGGRHITLHTDGTIELWSKETLGNEPPQSVLTNEYQSKMLKKMILSEHELEK